MKPTRVMGGAPRGWGPGAGRFLTGTGRTTSEVEVADVLGVEDVRLAEQHGCVGADLELAEVAGGERVTLLAGDRAIDQRGGGVGSQGAQVFRVPQGEGVDGAVGDVVAHVVRRAEPGQLDLALVVRRLQVAGGRGDADRRGRDDALEV